MGTRRMPVTVQDQLNDVCKDALVHRNFVVFSFVIISIAVVSVGAIWPRIYSSTTTIFVEEENILGPLMQGAAVQTEVMDRARSAREMIFGQTIMMKLLDRYGFLIDNPDPVEQDRMIDSIKSRTEVSTVRANLVSITYKDRSPKRAYEIASELADLFINESLDSKARESQSAFDFINQQVEEYQEKMLQSEAELKKFKKEHMVSGLGSVAEVTRKIGEHETQLQAIQQELREERIRKISLERQLSGEAAAATQFTRAEMFRKRIGELKSDLAKLRLSYHETYPDIVRVKAQIKELRGSIEDEANKRRAGSGSDYVDESAYANPVYQQLQQQLYNSNTQISTLEARMDQVSEILAADSEEGKILQEYDAKLAELARDNAVNSDIYSDLVRRRETARVSMNLDREQKGLTLRIEEPASFPHQPSGARFMHFVMAGPALGLIVPVVLLFLFRQLDPRIKSASVISEDMGFVVLGSIPHLATPRQRLSAMVGVFGTFMVFTMGIVALFIIIANKIQGTV